MNEPRFAPGQLIEVKTYADKPRDELGEVWRVTGRPGAWLLHVRCFVAAGEKVKFRNFFESMLVAE